MAKIKTFMVEVEITTRVMVFVDARKAGGAREKIQTQEGWREAVRYSDPDENLPMWWNADKMKITDVREMPR